MKPPEYKKKFRQKYSKILGNELEEFLEYSLKPLPKTIRVNTNKTTKKELVEKLERKGWRTRNLKFYDNALTVLEKNCALGNTAEHFLGYYYVQEAASMLPPLALQPTEENCVLDSCASPGSKTTQISMMMNNKGAILANDVTTGRVKILVSNCQRMGCKNVITTKSSATSIFTKGKFDKIIVDAPCSATGAIRKNYDIITQWNENVSLKICTLQKKILYSCLQALKPEGELVYSTCTLEPEENENVINHAIQKYNVKIRPVRIKGFKTRPGITGWNGEEYDKSIRNCARVYPQDNDTEGFFIARMTK